MTALDIIATMVGLVGGSTGLWTLLNLQTKRRAEKAHSAKEVAEADAAASDNWQRFAEKMESELDKTRQEMSELRGEVFQLRQENAQILVFLKESDALRCERVPCPFGQRKPPLGTHDSLSWMKTEK